MGRKARTSTASKITIALSVIGAIAVPFGIYQYFNDNRAIFDFYPQHGDNSLINSIYTGSGEGDLIFYAVNTGKGNAHLTIMITAEGAQIRNDTSSLANSAHYTYNYVHDPTPNVQTLHFYFKPDPSSDRIVLQVNAGWDGLLTEARYRFDKSTLVFDRAQPPGVSTFFNYNRTAST